MPEPPESKEAMITYRKKSLKVKIVSAESESSSQIYTSCLAFGIKRFIEKGEYSRIADIIIISGNKSASLRAVIIYEEAKSL